MPFQTTTINGPLTPHVYYASKLDFCAPNVVGDVRTSFMQLYRALIDIGR
jgi:hypothetical protein